MTALPRSASPSDVERVRLLYRETNVPAEVLASCLGLAKRSFYRRIDEWGWPRRRAGWAPGLLPKGLVRQGVSTWRHAEEARHAPSRSRHPRGASVETPAARAPQDDAVGSSRSGRGPSRESIAHAMERFIAERLAALQKVADADPERTARAIAQYARALQVLQATRAQADKEPTPDDAEPPARSLSELRDELRGHLERIWDETRARRRALKARPDAG